jgi:hypothetical protein
MSLSSSSLHLAPMLRISNRVALSSTAGQRRHKHYKVLVVGGGPGGLSVAASMAKESPKGSVSLGSRSSACLSGDQSPVMLRNRRCNTREREKKKRE